MNRGPVDEASRAIVGKAKKLAKQHGIDVVKYALTLHDPELYKSRYPDPYPRRSALYQSVQEFDVPISYNFDNSDLNGRFAIALRPILGDISNFNTYRAYVPKSDAVGWSTGVFTDDDFVPQSSAADPRQDPEVDRLIGTVPACSAYYTYETTDSPPTTSPQWDPLIAERFSDWNKSFDNTGVTVRVDHSLAPEATFVDFPPTAQPMQYRLAMQGALLPTSNDDTPIWTGGAQRAISVLNAGGVNINDVTGYSCNTLTATECPANQVGGDSDRYKQVWSRIISVEVGPSGGTIEIRDTISNNSVWLSNTTTPAAGKFASPAPKRIRFAIAGFPSISEAATFGLVKNLRPVGTSLLLKWVGPLIENAGKISAALAPIGTFGPEIFRPTAQTFNPFFYEAYQRLNNGGDGVSVMHTSRLDRGCYVHYLPQSVQNTEFKSYSDMNTADWPLLCCAGQYFKASSPLSGGEGIFLRARMVSVYEYTTNSRIPEVETLSRAIPNAVPLAYNILADLEIPCVMENDIHSIYTKILEGLQMVLNDVASTVGGAAGSLVGSFKNKSGVIPTVGFGPTGVNLSFANV